MYDAPRRPRRRQVPSFFALTEATGKSVKKEASENQPHPCMKQNPQGRAIQNRFSELRRSHPPCQINIGKRPVCLRSPEEPRLCPVMSKHTHNTSSAFFHSHTGTVDSYRGLSSLPDLHILRPFAVQAFG